MLGLEQGFSTASQHCPLATAFAVGEKIAGRARRGDAASCQLTPTTWSLLPLAALWTAYVCVGAVLSSG